MYYSGGGQIGRNDVINVVVETSVMDFVVGLWGPFVAQSFDCLLSVIPALPVGRMRFRSLCVVLSVCPSPVCVPPPLFPRPLPFLLHPVLLPLFLPCV